MEFQKTILRILKTTNVRINTFPLERENFKALILLSMAIDPSLVADREERKPRKPPIGVRATPTMQTSIQMEAYKFIRTITHLHN